jgi:hypothetical protein
MSDEVNDVSLNTDKNATDLAKDYFEQHQNLNELVDKIRLQEKNSDEPLLLLGEELSRFSREIKTQLKNDKLAKQVFVEMKKQAAEKMDVFDVTTINKVVKIADNETIQKYKKEGKLPNRWSTLALLTPLKGEVIEKLMANNSITADTSRRDLKAILDNSGLKPSKKSYEKTQTIILVRREKKHISFKDIEALTVAVNLLGWDVTTKHKEKLPTNPFSNTSYDLKFDFSTKD